MIDVNKEQRRASNPFSSVWVSASAGSGKTKVLTDRVLNLLLLTGNPEKILCLTFTKTAAAEMSNRISKVLKSWVTLPDEKLSEVLFNLIGTLPTSDQIDRARRLFALTLDTPGGMKIMTIHSFSQSVLKRFPLEAGISPHFDVMDDTTAADILTTLTTEAFKNPALNSYVELLSSYVDETGLTKLLKEALGMRHNLLNLIQKTGLDSIINTLKKNFKIFGYLSEKQIIEEVIDFDKWEETRKKYLYAKDGQIKKTYLSENLAHSVFETDQKLKAFATVQATDALLRIVFYIIELYENHKQSMALLDYDDLIEHTRRLLTESGKAAWVLYKLDGGIDHILVDEAQDTNPKQWAIIRMLAEEFFAGSGRSENLRTIFAVGDKKQSIYSFQGADPQEFEQMRLFFDKRVTESQNSFETVPFNFSFRSTEAVLRLVNFLLRYPPARCGVLEADEDGTHLARRLGEAGMVEIWPLEQPQKDDTDEGWKPPIDRVPIYSPVTRLAQKIALKIKQLIDSKEFLLSKGRPICAGDFLVLVQRRNKFVSELVRFLKEYQIPVAGVDRLVLTNYIAVQDLIGLAKFALLPEDDLNLAEILKSPLIRLTEEDLFKICYNRGNDSVFDRVCDLYPETATFLRHIMDKADKMPPFEFFSYILSVHNGRKHFEARLGNEVNEALDEFLNLTLTYEQNNIPSLQAFLKWIGDKDIEIKRDLDQGDLNAVRIMTVHGSKGLQGNIVFLPDTRFTPTQKPKIIWTPNQMPVWTPASDVKTDEISATYDEWQQNQMREYRRLLYVAVTRAMDRLYICGWDTNRKAREGNWYDLIQEALPYVPDSDDIIRFSCEQTKEIPIRSDVRHQNEILHTLPHWALENPPFEPLPSKPLRPSAQEPQKEAEQTVMDAVRLLSLKRGTFIHNLLQHLPTVAPEKRRETAFKLKPQDIDIPDTLFTLLEDNRFKDLFGPTSLAEVPIVGVLDGQVVSGQIDRLVILDTQVILVDYKSNF